MRKHGEAESEDEKKLDQTKTQERDREIDRDTRETERERERQRERDKQTDSGWFPCGRANFSARYLQLICPLEQIGLIRETVGVLHNFRSIIFGRDFGEPSEITS